MSVNDPIITFYDEKRNLWRLLQGRETFYDEDRYLRQWDTEVEALAWAKDNFPKATILRNKETIPMNKTIVVSTSLNGLPLFKENNEKERL